MVIRHLAPERVWQQQYADEVSCAAVTNGLSVQNMWAANQQASVSANQERFNNLQMFDPQNIWYLINDIHGNADNARRGTTKLFITEYEVSAAITNIENAPITLTEYRCVARYDQAYRTSETVTAGPPSNASGVPTTSITIDGADKILKQGFFAPTYAVNSGMGTRTNYYDYGVTPFDNPVFTRQFKIVKVKGKTLAPGETMNIKYRYRGNRCFGMERIVPYDPNNSSNYALDQLKGTGISVFTIKGTLAYNASADAGYKVGVSNAAVGCIYKTRIRYTWLDPNAEARNIINELPGFTNGQARIPTIPVVRGLMNVQTATGASGSSEFVSTDPFPGND